MMLISFTPGFSRVTKALAIIRENRFNGFSLKE